jgi:putative SOS response-associated peptidase YedK
MCTRFELSFNAHTQLILEGLGDVPTTLRPTDWIPVVLPDKTASRMRWGLTPGWAKEDFGAKLILARSDTVFEKASFKVAVERRRCLIPATHYFEWRSEFVPLAQEEMFPDPTVERKMRKQIYAFGVQEKPIFYFAGIWEEWWHPNGSPIQSVSMLTCEPNEMTRRYHSRMPCILSDDAQKLWMNPRHTSKEILKYALTPYPAEQMTVFKG